MLLGREVSSPSTAPRRDPAPAVGAEGCARTCCRARPHSQPPEPQTRLPPPHWHHVPVGCGPTHRRTRGLHRAEGRTEGGTGSSTSCTLPGRDVGFNVVRN